MMCSGEGAYQTVLGIQSAGVQVGVHVSSEIDQRLIHSILRLLPSTILTSTLIIDAD